MPSKVKKKNLHAIMYLNDNSIEEYAKIYNFQLNRTINGIPCPSEQIYLDINAETGKVLDVICSAGNLKNLESSENILSMEEAKKIFLASYKTTLKYSSGFDENPTQAKLIYAFELKDSSKFFNYVSATTGKPLDYEGRDILAEENF